MWVLDYLDDIESDLSVFHRIENLYEMPSVKLFHFATRLGAYGGVLSARAQQKTEDQDGAEMVPDDVFLSQHADLFTDK